MYTNLCIPGCLEVSYLYQPLYSILSRGQLCIPTSVFHVVFKVSYVYQPLYSRLYRGQLCIPTSVFHVVQRSAMYTNLCIPCCLEVSYVLYTNLCIPCCLEVSYVYQPLYSMLYRSQLCIPTSVFHVVQRSVIYTNLCISGCL